VDEILAVGDLAFQEKCIARLLDLRAQGRTLIFVSHETGRIPLLCERALWLDKGQLVMDGPAADVIATYETAARAGEPDM
jgi:ABC-2 type transport system ATP-binding protein